MIRINDFKCMSTLKAAAVVSVLFLFAAVAAFGQQAINLVASPTTATLPDGTIVPMWGYFCGAAVTGSTASCRSLNPNSLGTPAAWTASTVYPANSVILDSNGNVQRTTLGGTSGATPPAWATSGTSPIDGTVTWTFVSSLANYLVAATTTTSWSPVVITVPTGQGLTVNLTNNLSFTPAGATTANIVPTSIVIMGQVGGGLGSAHTSTPSPNHTDAQGCPTWFIAGSNVPPGVPCTTPGSGNPANAFTTPPNQGPRVQSMATEVTAGATTSLAWAALKPGTYLLESGTHPSIQVPGERYNTGHSLSRKRYLGGGAVQRGAST